MKIRNFKQATGNSWDTQFNNQFIEAKFQKNTDLMDAQRMIKKQKIPKRLPKKLTNKNFYCKTEGIQRYEKYILPQINLTKNLIVSAKSNELQKSEKLIRNSSKNTKILNQMIQILRDGSYRAEANDQKRLSKMSRKRTILSQSTANQFMQNDNKNQISTFHRGPKIIHPQFTKLCDHNLISRRKIFSEERSRPQLRKPVILKNNSPEQDPHTLTFYKPIKDFPKSNTESITNVIKDINADFCVEI